MNWWRNEFDQYGHEMYVKIHARDTYCGFQTAVAFRLIGSKTVPYEPPYLVSICGGHGVAPTDRVWASTSLSSDVSCDCDALGYYVCYLKGSELLWHEIGSDG